MGDLALVLRLLLLRANGLLAYGRKLSGVAASQKYSSHLHEKCGEEKAMMEVKRLLGLATQWLLARVLRYDLMLLTIVMCLITVGFITLFCGWILLPLAH